MILRPRQKIFVDHCVAALTKHGNTLGVAPTGAGKTIMLSAVAGRLYTQGHKKICVLAHRDELVSQNRKKFKLLNQNLLTSVYNASEKDVSGDAIFGMVQTLSRENNLASLPPIDLLVIDEAHHATASSYENIIQHVKDVNEKALVFGLTATPNRGDKKGLRPIFSNVADQIKVAELIASGHLVPPKTFVVNVGSTQEKLSSVKKTVFDYDMGAVEKIMNKDLINDEVIRHWREKAQGRKTVVFCSTVVHAQTVYAAFQSEGIKAAIVHGELSRSERAANLSAYENGDADVIVNVAVLTEGWDYQPTSCVILLRPSSFKSTMIQMIGRGLRTVDPALYPNVIKKDCIVLDFGNSTQIHGCLEEDINLDGREVQGDMPTKECASCGATISIFSQECPLCGHVFERVEDMQEELLIEETHLTEVDLMKRSPFLWEDIFGDQSAFIACGFNAWSLAIFHRGNWHALGGGKGLQTKLLSIGEKKTVFALAADFLNERETDDSAHKSQRWVIQPATQKQLHYLPAQFKNNFGLGRYRASALLNFQFNQKEIRQILRRAGGAL
ncbi:MAG: DEAD/DEAH box helicase family protein [Alphaproteobacteria bacterium]